VTRGAQTLKFSTRARPWLLAGLTSLFVVRVLYPSESAAWLGDGLPFVMLGLVVLALWLAVGIFDGGLVWRFGPIDVAVLILFAWHALSALAGAIAGAPRPAVNTLWEWVGLATAFFLARQLLRSERELRSATAVMIALATAVSAFGLHQYFVSLPETREAYHASPDQMLRDTGQWSPPGSPQRYLLEQRLASTEPMATFALANSLAGFLAAWLVVGLGAAASWPGAPGISRPQSHVLAPLVLAAGESPGAAAWPTRPVFAWQRWAFLLALSLIAACMLLTKSRSAYLGTFVGLVVLLLMKRRAASQTSSPNPLPQRGRGVLLLKAIVVLVAVASLIAVATAIGGLDLEVLTETPKSLAYRWQYWRGAMAIVGENPWLGCGGGNFGDFYTRYKPPAASEEIADPHNFVLEVWATTGTPGLLALLGVLACFGHAMTRLPQPSTHQHATAPQTATSTSRATTTPRASNTHRASGFIPEVCAARKVAAGGALGFLLAFLAGPLVEVPLSLPMCVGGLSIAAAVFFLLLPWIVHGVLTTGIVAAALAALATNLLGAGGIGFAGVAGSFWLLLALGSSTVDALDHWHKVSSAKAALMFVGALGIAAACYFSGYRPVMNCRHAMVLAESDPPNARQYLRRAAAADPLSAVPWQRLAELQFQDWATHPDANQFAQIEEADRHVLRLRARWAAGHSAAGDRQFAAFERTRDARHLRLAVDHYEDAVQLYPNSATHHARLAMALSAARQDESASRQRNEALRLDRLTPHFDQKLPEELRQRLLRMKVGEN